MTGINYLSVSFNGSLINPLLPIPLSQRRRETDISHAILIMSDINIQNKKSSDAHVKLLQQTGYLFLAGLVFQSNGCVKLKEY